MTTTTTTTKRCWICKRTKPLDQFAENKGKKDGRRTECRSCRTVEKRVDNARTSARKVGSASELTMKQLRDLMSWSSSCIYCGAELDDMAVQDIHLDHIVPLVRGGDSMIGNLTICCKKCSLSKGDRPAVVFMDQPAKLNRFVAMEAGISKEEAAVVLAADALEAQGIENAEQIAAACIILDSMGIEESARSEAPMDLLICAIQHFFASRFKLEVTDPVNVEDIRDAVIKLLEFEKKVEIERIVTIQ